MRQGRFFLMIILAIAIIGVPTGTLCDQSPSGIVVENEVKRFGPAWLTQQNGVYLLYVEGTDYEMAFQHAVLLKKESRNGEAPYLSSFFRKQIEHSIIGGIPVLVDLAEWFLHTLYFDPIACGIPASGKQALIGLANGTGIPYDTLKRAMVFSDSGQTIQGKIFTDLKVYPDLAGFADFGCTSFVAAGPATSNQHMLHGRNFDYTGAGWFDPYPTVVFCKPKSGQRYVMFTTAGMHTAGITGLNESGIAAGFHTAITTDVKPQGTPIFSLGDKIVREARTLDQAIAILRNHPPACGFIMVVSSAHEQKAALVEISHQHLSVFPMQNFTVGVANSYQTAELKKDEVCETWSNALNSFARTRRMNELLKGNFGSIDPQKGAEFLGDHFDVYTGLERATGDVIAQMHNVSSVLIDSTAMNFWIAVGPAPVCNTRYVGFNFYDGFSGPNFSPLPVLHGTWENDPRLEGYHFFIAADREFTENSNTAKALEYLDSAMAIAPDEPMYAHLAGLLLIMTNQPGPASAMFSKTLALPLTFHKQSLSHLWQARCYDLMGKRNQALVEYQKVLVISPLNPKIKTAAEKGLTVPFKASQAKTISINFMSGDSYGF